MQLVSTLLETFMKMKNPSSNVETISQHEGQTKNKIAKITKFSFAHLHCNIQRMMSGIWLKLKGVFSGLSMCKLVHSKV